MKIQVLGPGCQRCKTLTANAEKAIQELGVEATVEKVEDVREIMRYRILATPALVIDGQVKSAGRVLSLQEIQALLPG
jgi:small redox-active disulfide protein 2